MNYFKKTIAYILSFCLSILVIDFILDLPNYIIQNSKVVDIYTHNFFLKTFITEMILIFIYISLSEYIIKIANIKENYKKILLVAFITGIISGLFVVLHKYILNTNAFFNRWFNATGWTFVLYELIMVVTIYHVYNHLLEIL